MPTLCHTITPGPKGSVTLSYDGDTKIFWAGSPEFEKVQDWLKAGDETAIVDFLVNFKKAVESAYKDFRVVDDVVFITGPDGTEDSLPKVLGNRLLEFAKEGLPYQPIINFWNRLIKNPSYDSVQKLFECIEANHHPLHPDGRFLAWRKVRKTADGRLVDIYSGKVDNSVGQKPKMSRNQVDDNHNVTCSRGYHAASWNYARYHYGNDDDVMVEVLVDPADVVSVPSDYNQQKMRICSYEVVQIVDEENKEQLYGYQAVPDEDVDHDDDEDNFCPDCGEEWDDCSCYEDGDGF